MERFNGRLLAAVLPAAHRLRVQRWSRLTRDLRGLASRAGPHAPPMRDTAPNDPASQKAERRSSQEHREARPPPEARAELRGRGRCRRHRRLPPRPPRLCPTPDRQGIVNQAPRADRSGGEHGSHGNWRIERRIASVVPAPLYEPGPKRIPPCRCDDRTVKAWDQTPSGGRTPTRPVRASGSRGPGRGQ